MNILLHHPTRVLLALAGCISSLIGCFVFNTPIVMGIVVIYIIFFMTSGRKSLVYTGIGLLITYFTLHFMDTTRIQIENDYLKYFFVYCGLVLMVAFSLHVSFSRSSLQSNQPTENT
jgi:hypothetical protein